MTITFSTTARAGALTPNRARRHARAARHALAALGLAALASLGGCVGGDSVNNAPQSPVGVQSGQLGQQCAANNPFRADAVDANGSNPAATRIESLTREKEWIRAYVNEAYLWFDKVPSLNPLAADFSNESQVYASLDNYFSDLTVNRTNPAREDRFSFTLPTKQWRALSEQGVSLGYGIEFAVVSNTVPRVIRIAYVEPNTAAARAGLRRGDQVTSVNGFDIDTNTQAGLDAINAAIFPSVAGTNTLGFSRNGASAGTFALAAADVALTPVPTTRRLSTPSGDVGYIAFNDHILTAEDQLVAAFRSLAGVSDLVLDLRYNRGGFLFLAAQTGYMIAGAQRTGTRVFEKLEYNSKRSAESNSPNAITPFFNITRANATLPTLNLGRVWVLSTGSTCSASESIINGLRGIGVTVNVIGGNTCGKPFGFTARDNCGISYFPIEFKGVNAVGFGDFGNGFAPTCDARDDFSRAQGDPTEAMLAQALNHRATNSCSQAFAQGKAGENAAAMLNMSPVYTRKLHAPELAPGVAR
jgi:carboxyl-terminal processing protease